MPNCLTVYLGVTMGIVIVLAVLAVFFLCRVHVMKCLISPKWTSVSHRARFASDSKRWADSGYQMSECAPAGFHRRPRR
jgi:hypothetical protein